MKRVILPVGKAYQSSTACERCRDRSSNFRLIRSSIQFAKTGAHWDVYCLLVRHSLTKPMRIDSQNVFRNDHPDTRDCFSPTVKPPTRSVPLASHRRPELFGKAGLFLKLHGGAAMSGGSSCRKAARTASVPDAGLRVVTANQHGHSNFSRGPCQ